MNAKSLLISLSLFTIGLAACAPAATPVPVFPAPTSRPPYEEPAATSAPEATQALDYYSPTQTPPLDNTFQDYGVNPYTNAAEDHLSTFALDVDTASYTVARRYVMDGNPPPPDAIRVEEFVNYFKQDYPNPAETAFGIYADGAPSPFLRDSTQIWRIGLHGHSIPDSERLPASLTFVIDISGSMSMENRLELVKRSLQLLVDRLRPTDTVAIVVFGTDARVLLNPTSGEDRATILNAIYSLHPEGATNAEAGLQLGYQIANLAYRPGGINRVILCSDGVANVGVTGPDAILQSIRGYADAGITLTTVGFGMGNFNDELMEQLADNGDGNYAYVDDLEEAQRLFVDNLTSTLQVIALNAKVQVDFNSEVVSYYRLIGYENRAVADQDFRNNEVDAGEIGAGHTVTALYALQLRLNATGRLATVNLRWEDPQTHALQEVNGDFNTWNLTPSFDQASLRYQLDVVVAQYAEGLRRSPWAQGTSLSDLYIRAERLAAQLPDDPDVAEFASLVGQAGRISHW